MSKVLTIVIPSYNVENYLAQTLESFVQPDVLEDIEVLVVNDGSKDHTADIALEYEKKYPETFRLITKENGGHGSTINRGIEEARGKYFKVVDGDDWVDTKDFAALISRLRAAQAEYVVTNYYEVNDKTKEKRVVDFPGLKGKTVWKFDEIVNRAVIPMHALVIQTELLQRNAIRMDEHCFYVDNEYTAFPVPYVEKIEYYEDLSVYMYRLAVATQSVSVRGFQKHLADHVKVTLRLVDFAEEYRKKSENKQKADYLMERAAIMVGDQAGIYATFPSGDQEIRKQFIEFDRTVKKKSAEIYHLSDRKSHMLRGLRKSRFHQYGFWVTVSKIRARWRKV